MDKYRSLCSNFFTVDVHYILRLERMHRNDIRGKFGLFPSTSKIGTPIVEFIAHSMIVFPYLCSMVYRKFHYLIMPSKTTKIETEGKTV